MTERDNRSSRTKGTLRDDSNKKKLPFSSAYRPAKISPRWPFSADALLRVTSVKVPIAISAIAWNSLLSGRRPILAFDRARTEAEAQNDLICAHAKLRVPANSGNESRRRSATDRRLQRNSSSPLIRIDRSDSENCRPSNNFLTIASHSFYRLCPVCKFKTSLKHWKRLKCREFIGAV